MARNFTATEHSIAKGCLHDVALLLPEFTSAAVVKEMRRHFDTSDLEGRISGPLMKDGEKEGWIRKSDPPRWLSTGSHGRPQLVWESRIYQPIRMAR